jgi:osmoprotectant transport system ATP-binding protein
MIKLSNVSKSYNGIKALRNFFLELEKGKITVLIGPSGCGKSTIIRILTGLIKPDSGEVTVNNIQLNNLSIIEIRKSIGYVIQDGGLFPHLTARDNISLMPKYYNWGKIKITERIKDLSELTNFPKEALERYPVQLSGGQKQRIALMRALITDPDILLLDEPLGALDPLIRFELQTELKEIFIKLNKTVLMVTHDLAEAMFFGDQIILMKDGEIVQSGEPDAILNNPQNEFVKKFINAQRLKLETKK